MSISNEFGFGDEIDELLRGILEDKPAMTKAVITDVMKGQSNFPTETQTKVANAVKEVAAELMDPELYEMAEVSVTPRSNIDEPFTDSEIDTTRVPMPVFTDPELYEDAEKAGQGIGIGGTFENTLKVIGDAVTPRSNSPFTDSDDTPLDRVPMPVFTDTEIADKIDIRNFATLVTLNTSRWHAKVKDKQASRDAATVAGADQAAFETRKRLLVGADDLLKRIHQAIDVARTAHYQFTLPWSLKGLEDHGKRYGSGRLLPNTLFMEYTTVMAKAKREMEEALDAFEPEYPKLIQQAQKKLGTRFDAKEYPNPSSIRNHFDLSFDFQPIPQGDDFKGLASTQCEALADALNKRTSKMLENAMQEAWDRLHKVVAHAADRLSSPDKMFHYTLVENLRDTAKLIKHLNVTGDERIEKVRLYVEKNLTMHGVGDIKKDDKLRKHLGKHAHAALTMMKEAGNA